jgi:FkbM family methyltransferase
MKNVKDWYLPDWDTHFEKMLQLHNGKFEYQQRQRDYAFSQVINFNTNAIDAGSNIGFWSKQMCQKFKHVYAFEPHPDNIECYKENLKDYKNYTLYDVAISNVTNTQMNLYVSPDECGNASLNDLGVKEGTTDRKLSDNQITSIKVNVKKIDDYNFQNINFIKVDCQNHEKEVVEGGIETIDKWGPVLCLELPVRTKQETDYRNYLINYLKKYRYNLIGSSGKETLFTR